MFPRQWIPGRYEVICKSLDSLNCSSACVGQAETRQLWRHASRALTRIAHRPSWQSFTLRAASTSPRVHSPHTQATKNITVLRTLEDCRHFFPFDIHMYMYVVTCSKHHGCPAGIGNRSRTWKGTTTTPSPSLLTIGAISKTIRFESPMCCSR